eukprot:2798655-Amphidinium_carterae.1
MSNVGCEQLCGRRYREFLMFISACLHLALAWYDAELMSVCLHTLGSELCSPATGLYQCHGLFSVMETHVVLWSECRKRTRISVDGSKLLKVFLDPKECACGKPS